MPTEQNQIDNENMQVRITALPIDHVSLTEFVRTKKCGAVVQFLGTVREITGDKITTSLEYEAYEEMAILEIKRIIEAAREKWAIEKISLVHRIGHLELGEIAIGIAISTPHRSAGFEAIQFLMNQIKETVPIWKKETWADGSTDWIHPQK